MRRPFRIDRRSRIGYEVLSYLVEHPESQDTLEGIVEWWLLEQEIKHQTALVREALAGLVEQGLVVERLGADMRSHYQINREKLEEIRRRIETWTD